MRITIKYFLTILLLGAVFISCKKDKYKNDGGTHSPNVNMTTYDYLKQHGSFDSLIAVIDLAGMKDMVNSSKTFFAVPDWGINDYVKAKKQQKIIETGDENISFSVKDLDVYTLRDSLKMYMYPELINRQNLTVAGKEYTSAFGPMANDTRMYIRLRRIVNYNSYVGTVDFINFGQVIGTLDTEEPDVNAIPISQRDKTVDCQTSGIITTTGTLHVVNNFHRLFFNNEPLP